MAKNHSFRHESIQDGKTIQDILKAINKGLAKGKLTLSDDNGELEMVPQGLLNLKLSASQDSGLNKLKIHISWQDQQPKKPGGNLTINHED